MASNSRSKRNEVHVRAKDKDLVSDFYRRCLAIRFSQSYPKVDILYGDGIDIFVHQDSSAIAPTQTDSPKTVEKQPSSVLPALFVEDIGAVRDAVERTGGKIQPLTEAKRSWGTLRVEATDPEGNQIIFKYSDA